MTGSEENTLPLPSQTRRERHAKSAAPLPPPQRYSLCVAPFGTKGAYDLQAALQKRLRLTAVVAAAGFAVWLGLGLLRWRQEWLADPWRSFTRPPGYGKALPLLAIEASAALWLTWRVMPVRWLRLLEWLIVGPLVAFFANKDCMNIQRVSLEELTWNVGTFANDAALGWVILMIGYGVLIPNTWRRCAWVTGFMGLAALVPSGVALAVKDMPAIPAAQYLGVKSIGLGVAAVILTYGAYRINVLSEEAREALQLGQYQLKRYLGRGGMGEVYLAEHCLLRRLCAVKMIRPEWAGDPQQLLSFEREVHATATLTHPNTVQIFDYGHTEEGTFYYIMEYLPGLTLETLVGRHGPLPAARAIHFLRQICGALQEAHAIGLIHRDIKPGNVMVCERGRVHDVAKLLDFGAVACSPMNWTNGTSTSGSGGTGTPAYMSPEQIAGGELDQRSDIYSLGCLGYFLLTGHPPFTGIPHACVLAAHLHEPPPPLARCGDLSLELREIISRCLAKTPGERFTSVNCLSEAFGCCPTRQAGRKQKRLVGGKDGRVARKANELRSHNRLQIDLLRTKAECPIKRHPFAGKPKGLAGERAHPIPR